MNTNFYAITKKTDNISCELQNVNPKQPDSSVPASGKGCYSQFELQKPEPILSLILTLPALQCPQLSSP